MQLKDQIRIARSAAGLTQAALAEILQVSKQSIIWWESGEHRPKTGRICELEEALNVRLDLSEIGNATPRDGQTKSIAVDPDTLNLAVAISRLPLEQRKAIETLVYIGERTALGKGVEAFSITEHADGAKSNSGFVLRESVTGKLLSDATIENPSGSRRTEKKMG